MLKMFNKLFLPYLAGVINHSIATSSFPDERELSKVMSDLKKDDHFDKENYRIKSLLSNTSKIFQNIFFIQINDYINLIFQDILTELWRNHSTQHCLIKMLENSKHLLHYRYNYIMATTTQENR